jgi:two-component system, OmpR family, response regulator
VRLLLVEDERPLAAALDDALREEGWVVDLADNGREGLRMALVGQYDVVVLDIMLPLLNGYDVLKYMRAQKVWSPVLMLTAKDGEYDQTDAFDLGADDYLTKPFNPRELVARIKAVLRRSEAQRRPSKVLEAGDLRLDLLGREVAIAGKPVQLRAKEFELLTTLMQNQGIAMPRERLLTLVWGEDFFGDGRTLDVHIAWLRDKISASTAKIITVWGFGYKLVGPDAQAAATATSSKAGA